MKSAVRPSKKVPARTTAPGTDCSIWDTRQWADPTSPPSADQAPPQFPAAQPRKPSRHPHPPQGVGSLHLLSLNTGCVSTVLIKLEGGRPGPPPQLRSLRPQRQSDRSTQAGATLCLQLRASRCSENAETRRSPGAHTAAKARPRLGAPLQREHKSPTTLQPLPRHPDKAVSAGTHPAGRSRHPQVRTGTVSREGWTLKSRAPGDVQGRKWQGSTQTRTQHLTLHT